MIRRRILEQIFFSFILFSTNAMEFLTSFLLFFIAAFLFYISTRRPKNFPEGLARIPIIGQGKKFINPNSAGLLNVA